MTKEGDDKGPGPYRNGVGAVGVDQDRASSSSCHVWVPRKALHPMIIRHLYALDGLGLSIRQVGKALGVSPSRVYRAMVWMGIPRRDPGRRLGCKNEEIGHVSGVGTLGQVLDSKEKSRG